MNSHPVALMQCREFLSRHPHIKVVEAEDTAGSAEAISRLQGIRCGFKPTSCPDQLSRALIEALKHEENQ